MPWQREIRHVLALFFDHTCSLKCCRDSSTDTIILDFGRSRHLPRENDENLTDPRDSSGILQNLGKNLAFH